MRIFTGLLMLLMISGCSTSQNNEATVQSDFFNLRNFFEKEGKHLQSLNKPVYKTVSRNNVSEQKLMTVNWSDELELFAASDINKAGWKDSYQTITSGDSTEYIALDDNLKTKRILIVKDAEQIRHVSITNKTTNFLYRSVEQLDYFRDSVVSISKNQSVRVIGQNRYTISIRIK